MSLKNVFKMPKPVKITGRTSSITNSFVNGIIPVIEPTEEEIKEALSILGMDEKTICCAYCGDPYTEWDYLRPLVMNKTATGYVSEIHNLVPACGKCNQSKGNQNWSEWMYGNATLSPASRKIPDIDERHQRLSQYEKWGSPIKVDIEAIVGKYKWQQHWENCEKIKTLMHESQVLSNEIRATLQSALNSSNKEIAKCFHDENQSTPIFTEHAEMLCSIKPQSNFNKHIINSLPFDITKAVAKIVQNEFIQLLKSEKIGEDVISFLQKADYSKEMFDMNFPILLHIDSIADSRKGVDRTGINRYYAKPIQIRGELFLVTSQWYERNKTKLLHWIANYQ